MKLAANQQYKTMSYLDVCLGTGISSFETIASKNIFLSIAGLKNTSTSVQFLVFSHTIAYQ